MPETEGIEIHERIDSGLYGSVYRATQQPLGRQVAVKIIKTDLKTADALAHAAPLARANHPAIVTVFTVQEVHLTDPDLRVPAIVMEWVEGDTLGKRLETTNPITQPKKFFVPCKRQKATHPDGLLLY